MKKSSAKKVTFITETPTLIVGVDIAKNKHCAKMFDIKGYELYKGMAISNDEAGFKRFLQRLEWIKEKHKFKRVIVGFEPTGPYWLCLAT